MRSIGLHSSKTTRTTLVCLICACLILSLTTDCFAKRRSKTVAVGISLFTTAALTGAGALLLHHSDEAYEADRQYKLQKDEGHPDLGLALFLTGAIIGPGTGHIYAGRPVRIIIPALVRGAGMFVFSVGGIIRSLEGDPGDEGWTGSGLLMWTGGLVVCGAFLYDLFDVADSVDYHNYRLDHPGAGLGLKFNPERKQAMLMLTVPI